MLAIVGVPAHAAGEGILLESGASAQSQTLGTGALLLVEQQNGPLEFAGHTIQQQGFTGILGYASEVAYVLVIDGMVRTGDNEVRPGRMLLIPPYGSEPVVQRYDAERLLPKWGEQTRNTAPSAFAQLEDIAKGQRMGLRFGRFSRSPINVSAPGGQQPEMARRSFKGAQVVQSIRFSGEQDMTRIEAQVVEHFLAAIAGGDVETVAALMDPEPFGNANLSPDASDARRLMADRLIKQQNWPTLLAGARPVREADGNLWRIEGSGAQGFLVLRPVADFVFVRTIQMGDGA